MIFVKCDGWECGIGGYALDCPSDRSGKRDYSKKGLEAIANILDVVGVDNWEDLKGKHIRIKDNGWGSRIDEIGNLMESKWFNLREFFSN
jgi:hypothetical protein